MSFNRRHVIKGSVYVLGLAAIDVMRADGKAFAQAPPNGKIRVARSSDTEGFEDLANIQNAIDELEPAGGTVELDTGTYYLSGRLTIRNRVSIRGVNSRATEIRPGRCFNDNYLVEFRNPPVPPAVESAPQFNCRLEELSLRCSHEAGGSCSNPSQPPQLDILAAVWARSWNEQCGLRNVLIWEYMKHAVLFTDGFGGTATFELRECEFMSAGTASTSYPGLFFATPHTVGYTNAVLEHVIVSGPSSPTGYTCIEARNGLNLIVTGGHVEQCEYGIYMTNRSNLTLTGFTGSPTGVTNLIGCAGDFSGTVFGSAVLKAGATGHVLRDNKLGNHITSEQNPLVFP